MDLDRTIKRINKTEIRYFQSYKDEFVESQNQSYKLPENYIWSHHNPVYRLVSICLYRFVVLFTFFYFRFCMHAKVENRAVLKQCSGSGCFLYGNHTQPLGDVFNPLRILSPKRGYVIASPANLGIPMLGPLLPMLGALPIPESVSGMKKLMAAISLRIQEGSCVIIYPEAHVWPWYTGIRPFPETSLGFAVENNAPAFCMTTTYQSRKHNKKPKITIYLDGPFYPDHSIPKKKQKEKLHHEIYNCMLCRSKNSTFDYIRYYKADGSMGE